MVSSGLFQIYFFLSCFQWLRSVKNIVLAVKQSNANILSTIIHSLLIVKVLSAYTVPRDLWQRKSRQSPGFLPVWFCKWKCDGYHYSLYWGLHGLKKSKLLGFSAGQGGDGPYRWSQTAAGAVRRLECPRSQSIPVSWVRERCSCHSCVPSQRQQCQINVTASQNHIALSWPQLLGGSFGREEKREKIGAFLAL